MDSSELRRGRDFKLQLDLKEEKKENRLKIHRFTEHFLNIASRVLIQFNLEKIFWCSF